ncbi:MAG: zinc-dependent alcohol dehydrogenase family protein [Candidatus Aminicenantes bacterium]|nr:zinc-dependent alcohol dehydrogenase family protein [Candidatus Aminicenantes bacterium]
MKAMILRVFKPTEEHPLGLVDLPVPKPGPGEVLMRVNVCGVCHTDLHTVEGELPEVKLPIIPGHQAVGIVEEMGEGCRRFKKGGRIGAAWLHSACAKCPYCLGGRENLCLEGRFTGYHVNGGYAEFMTVPEKFAYSLPAAFSDEEAAPLLCAGIIGYRALRLSEIKPGGTLGLYGFGASAHIAIQIAAHWGCRVYVFSRSREHQELARVLGAVWTGSAQESPPDPMDAAIIFAPAGELVPAALANTAKGGTVALAGIYMTPIPELDYQKHLYQERVLRSVANATRRDGEELLKVAAEIPVKTHIRVFPLEEANQVLWSLKQGKISGAAVLKIGS